MRCLHRMAEVLASNRVIGARDVIIDCASVLIPSDRSVPARRDTVAVGGIRWAIAGCAVVGLDPSALLPAVWGIVAPAAQNDRAVVDVLELLRRSTTTDITKRSEP